MERAELGLATAAAASAHSAAGDLLEGAQRVLPGVGAASPLGTVVFSFCASRLDIETGNGAWGLAAGYALMGYACRAAASGRAVKEDDTSRLGAELPFTRGGDVDYERLLDRPADLAAIVDRVATVASGPELLADLALLDRDRWTAFEVAAARRLRSQYLRRGAAPASLPTERRAHELLRLGFALRILDEVAGEAPAGPVRTYRDGAGSSEVPNDADGWLRAAAAICMEDLEPPLDELLDAGVPHVLGTSRGRLDSDDEAMAFADARLGFALRRHEHHAPPPRERSDEPFSSEAASVERLADLPVFVSDVVRYGYCGGAVAAMAGVPSAGADVRQAATWEWIQSRRHQAPHRPAEDVLALVRYGYLLHRALELRSDGERSAEASGAGRGDHGGD